MCDAVVLQLREGRMQPNVGDSQFDTLEVSFDERWLNEMLTLKDEPPGFD